MRNAELGAVRNHGGFTLIETVITLVVLSIAAVGVLSVFTVGIKGSANPGLVSQATHLAQEKMDEAVALKKSGGFDAVVSVAAGPFVPAVPGFTWSRTVFCVNAGSLNTNIGAPPCATGYAHVTVTVTNATIGNLNLDGLVANY
jgi:prepilin-type N-terminal cleavage/methylation domain-containing protein